MEPVSDERTSKTTTASVNEKDVVKPLSKNAEIVFKTRLSLKKPGGGTETPAEAYHRVARFVASVYEDDNSSRERSFFEMMASLCFMPNSPAFTGAGTPLGQLAACFVLPIDDDMGKQERGCGIFQTLRDAALIQQTGGGVGFSFNRLRAKGSVVHSSGGQASGPVSFMKVYNGAFGAIAQGGTRRGASMAVLSVDHPDIEEFISCKECEGTLSNFNISVAVSSSFMHSAVNNKEYVAPDGRHIDAARLLYVIATAAHRNGEPGVLFMDTANKGNPMHRVYTYEATNPCGEQFLGPYECCCLGSVNLAMHMREGCSKSHAELDWLGLRNTVRVAVDMLDSMIDANKYVPAVPELAEMAHSTRRIGLGIMGLADVFYRKRLRYGSSDSLVLAGAIGEWMRFCAMERSAELAAERGPFPLINSSIYDPEDPRRWYPPVPEERTPPGTFGMPVVDWEGLRGLVERVGIRNAAVLTVAPTGTIATVCGCEGYGCEPAFSLCYVRHVVSGDDLTYTSPLFEAAVRSAVERSEDVPRVLARVAKTGSARGISSMGVAPWVENTFVTSKDITPEEHVNMQAALQRWVDSSISKTVNMPRDATVEQVRDAYIQAWSMNCKGLTVYVEGSREHVVLETAPAPSSTATHKTHGEDCHAQTPKQPVVPQLRPSMAHVPPKSPAHQHNTPSAHDRTSGLEIVSEVLTRVLDDRSGALPSAPEHRVERPDALNGCTHRTPTPLGDAYVTLNSIPARVPGLQQEPFEVFINVGKSGSNVSSVSEALGRLVSYILRMRVPDISPRTRLRDIADQLCGIGGRHQRRVGSRRFVSLSDALASVFYKYLDVLPADVVRLDSTDLCPECGYAALIESEGCRRCANCDHTEC